MKMRNMKRQLLLSALLSCGLLSAAAVIDDFETGNFSLLFYGHILKGEVFSF